MIEETMPDAMTPSFDERELPDEHQETSQSQTRNNEDILKKWNPLIGIIESLLFVSERPVTIEQIKKVLGAYSSSDIKSAIQVMNDAYKTRQSGISVVEIAGGYQMLTNPKYAAYVKDFYKTKHKEKLSKPALETMAIIAYKQPVTRADIELVRGVNSDGVVGHLLNKELIKVVGRKDVPGRPYLYGTTKSFLEYFGLKSLENLPKLEEFPGLIPPAINDSPMNSDPRPQEEGAVQEEGDDSGDDVAEESSDTQKECVPCEDEKEDNDRAQEDREVFSKNLSENNSDDINAEGVDRQAPVPSHSDFEKNEEVVLSGGNENNVSVSLPAEPLTENNYRRGLENESNELS